jgi:mevalonate kinase
MSETTGVSVPGKLILIGEHAVVYGRPAVAAAVDLRLRARLESIASGVRISLPGMGAEERTDWSSVLGYAAGARERWRRFAEHPSPESFREVRGEDPAHVVKVALGEVAGWCGDGGGPQGLTLRIESRIPIGSGFGSSAATAVGVVAGYLVYRRRRFDEGTIDHLALEVERRQHGTPSGVDHATILRGGVVWARTDEPGGGVRVEPLGARSPLLDRLRVYDSGRPAEPTGAVVSAVREWVRRDGARAGRVFDRMEAGAVGLRQELVASEEDPVRTIELIREYERCLEELGVVPEPVCRVVREVESHGGAAKISGAGSLAGPGAGGLLVYHAEPEAIARWAFLGPLRQHTLRLGAPGLRQEPGP